MQQSHGLTVACIIMVVEAVNTIVVSTIGSVS